MESKLAPVIKSKLFIRLVLLPRASPSGFRLLFRQHRISRSFGTSNGSGAGRLHADKIARFLFLRKTFS
jgi:hypothetical protein